MPGKWCAIHGKTAQNKYKSAHPQIGSMNMCSDCYFDAYPTGDNGNGCKLPLPMKHTKPPNRGSNNVAFCDGIKAQDGSRVLVSDLPDDQPIMTDIGREADNGKAYLGHWRKHGVLANGSQCAQFNYGTVDQFRQDLAERRGKKRKQQAEAAAEVNLACDSPAPGQPAPLYVATTGEYALGPYTGKSANVHPRPLLGAMIQGCFRPHQRHIGTSERKASKRARTWASTDKGRAIQHVLNNHTASSSKTLHFDHPSLAS